MRKDGENIYLTPDEAIALLPDRDRIHTFVNPNGMLIGADHERESLIKDMREATEIMVTGEMAQNMGHGLCFKHNGRYLFVESANYDKQ